MDPKKTVEVRIEGDWEQIVDILDDQVGKRIDAFEITKMPDGTRPNPPCFGCGHVQPANRLHLYSVRATYADASEEEPCFIMAIDREDAAALYHMARARDHGNVPSEIIVSKIADAGVCDE